MGKRLPTYCMELKNEDNLRWYGKGERGPPLGRRSATLKAEGEGLNSNSKTQSSNQCKNGNNKSIPNVKIFTLLHRRETKNHKLRGIKKH